MTLHALDCLKTIISLAYIYFGVLDSWKYHYQASAIRKIRTSRGHSRKFVNITFFDKIVGILFGYFIVHNWMVILTSVLAAVTTLEYFWMEYLYYPYRRRNQPYWKRPSVIKYFINSVLPNKVRKHL